MIFHMMLAHCHDLVFGLLVYHSPPNTIGKLRCATALCAREGLMLKEPRSLDRPAACATYT